MKAPLLFSALLSTLSFNALASYSGNFTSTRLKSTAGVGIGSILMEESTQLNPATMAFFNSSSIYLERSSLESALNEEQSSPISTLDKTKASTDYALVFTDTKKNVAGSFSIVQKEIDGVKDRSYAVALASPIGKATTMGINTKFNSFKERNFKRLNIGISHVIDTEFTMGFMLENPLKQKGADSVASVGAQYLFKGMVALILDGGSYYDTDDFRANTYFGAATQFKVLDSFYIRLGAKKDQYKKLQKAGIGASWVQPRLTLQAAMEETELEESAELNQIAEKITETSFSISYRF